MKRIATATCAVALFALIACPLSACSSGQGAENAVAAEAAKQLDPAVRANIETIVAQARENDFDNVTFSMKTETTATSRDEEGNTEQQVVTTNMSGELDQAGEKPALHMNYEAASNMSLEKTTYDMYIDSTGLIVSQDGRLFKNPVDEDSLENYARTITAASSEDELTQLLDIASSYTLEEKDNGDTAITIVADVEKLAETTLIDTSSLPEGSSVATLVASYVVDADDHIKSVRLLSSTTGLPTYRVDQNYQFSHYNSTDMPEWPDMATYFAEQTGIQTDDEGRMYMIGDDGQTYYIESIDDDGTIHFQMPTAQTSDGDSPYYYGGNGGGSYSGTSGGVSDLYDYITFDGGGASGTADASNAGSADTASNNSGGSDVGRAYIEVEGNKYYLDEGRVVDVGGGARLFYPGDGTQGAYFLNEDD